MPSRKTSTAKRRSKMPSKMAHLEGYRLRSRDTRQNKPKEEVAPKPGVNWLEILPREVRDMIYEYALTERYGLCHWADYADPDEEAIHFDYWTVENVDCRDANQLRLVNKQFHQETSGLGIRFNDLTLVNPWRDQNGEIIHDDTFTRFISTMHPKHAKYLNRITVLDTRSRPTDPEPSVIALKLSADSPIPHLLSIAENLLIVARFDRQDRLPVAFTKTFDGLAEALRDLKPLFDKEPRKDCLVGLTCDENDVGWSDFVNGTATEDFYEGEDEMLLSETDLGHDAPAPAGVVEESVDTLMADGRDVHEEGI